MNEKEQIMELADRMDKLINGFRDEWDLSYASVVGVLMMKAHLLMQEASEEE